MSEEVQRLIKSDIAIAQRDNWDGSEAAEATEGTLQPVTIPLLVDMLEVNEAFIQIRHRPSHDLVAVLELLSPASRSPSNRHEYLHRRNAVLRESIHLVELDLLLDGQRLPLRRRLPKAHYYGLVSRADRRPNCDVYYWTVRDALPKIPIPLRSPDPDLIIDLDAVFKLAWQRGRYERAIDYRNAESLKFENADRTWVLETARAG